jgi:phenylacetate-CoA ligase
MTATIRFNEMRALLNRNQFYADRLKHAERFEDIPFTTKQQLVDDQANNPPFGTNLTFPIASYTRIHQTSGTAGKPILWLDTQKSWDWWLRCWDEVFKGAGVRSGDRVYVAFSFGPFIGFWSAHDALVARGGMVIPSGGMNTLARIELIHRTRATALLCTPSYALRLAEVARENHIDPASLEVRRIIVAGEPGGSAPAVRRQIESAWNAAVIDHAGASEVGPWGFGDKSGHGLFVIENEFIAEFLSLATGAAAADGELAELVLTSLGRHGSPVGTAGSRHSARFGRSSGHWRYVRRTLAHHGDWPPGRRRHAAGQGSSWAGRHSVCADRRLAGPSW